MQLRQGSPLSQQKQYRQEFLPYHYLQIDVLSEMMQGIQLQAPTGRLAHVKEYELRRKSRRSGAGRILFRSDQRYVEQPGRHFAAASQVVSAQRCS